MFLFQDISQASKWYLDSGCSRHMTGDRKLFTSFRDEIGQVTYGDNRKEKVLGCETIGSKEKDLIEDVM